MPCHIDLDVTFFIGKKLLPDPENKTDNPGVALGERGSSTAYSSEEVWVGSSVILEFIDSWAF